MEAVTAAVATVAVIMAEGIVAAAVIMVAAEDIISVVEDAISAAGIMAAAIFTAARRISVRSPGIARFPPSARISRAAAAL